MAETKNKMYYDEEVDILMLSKERKVQHSVDCDPFIIDIDFSGAISGVEILDATETLKLDKDKLKSLKEARLKINYEQNLAYVMIILYFNNTEELKIPLKVSLGQNHIRTENIKFATA
jgi:uncharacterized protein YuzE